MRRPDSFRRGFATVEIFLVSFILFGVGLTISLAMRWLTGTSHWISWGPAFVLGIPFVLVYGCIVPAILCTAVRDQFTSRTSHDTTSTKP